MASVNRATLIGNAGRDAEVRYLADGKPVANVTLATTDTWKDKESGEKREATEWHRVVLFDKLAEVAGQYVKKGRQIYVEGKLKTRKWKDKEGGDRYTTEIHAHDLKLLGKAEDGAAPSSPGAGSVGGGGGNGAAPAAGNFDDFEDDIPFVACDFAFDPAARRALRHRGRG